MKKTNALLATVSLASLLAGGVAHAQSLEPITGIVAFGDSLSDNGNLFGLTLGTNPPSPPYAQRFSNGPVWVEQLPALLAANGQATSTLTIDQNFAVGGARSEANHNIVPGTGVNSGFLDQVNGFAAGGRQFAANEVATVWIGANDYLDNLATAADPNALVGGVIQNIATGIGTLAQANGARRFIVLNLPNIGDSPLQATIGAASAAGFNQVVGLHNALLAQTLDGLEAQLGLDITLVDVNTAFGAILNNPAAFGFTNVTTPCVSATGVAAACLTAQGQAETLFFDAIHPTTAGHAQVAQLTRSTLNAIGAGANSLAVSTQLGLHMSEGVMKAVDARLARLRAGGNGISAEGNQLPDTIQSSDGPIGAFIYADFANGDRDAGERLSGYDYNSNTVAVGADMAIDDDLVFGGSLFLTSSEADIDGNAGTTESTGFGGVVYATFGSGASEGFYVDGSVGFNVITDIETTRQTLLAAAPTVNGDTDGSALFGSLTVGYTFDAPGNFSLSPFVGLRYTESNVNGYTETGGLGLSELRVDDVDATSAVFAMGVTASTVLQSGGAAFYPQLRLALETETGNDDSDVTASLLTGQSTSFRSGAETTAYLRAGFGLGFSLGGGVSALADIDTTLGRSGGDDMRVSGRLKIGF